MSTTLAEEMSGDFGGLEPGQDVYEDYETEEPLPVDSIKKRNALRRGLDLDNSSTTESRPQTTKVTEVSNSRNDAIDHTIAAGGIINALQIQLKDIERQVFTAMLVLILVGEIFASPSERLTEELWLNFLDSADLLEKSRTRMGWSCIGHVLTPAIVVVIIDRLPCKLPFINMHHIFIHFHLFFIVLGLALLFTFCYPGTVSDTVKAKKWSRIYRGVRIVCSDVCSILNAGSVLIIGFVEGFTSIFLFWILHDLFNNGSELPYGLAVTAVAAGDLVIFFIGDWLGKKMGHYLCVILGFIVLSLRCLLYSFLASTSPWLAIAGESFSLLSNSLIWSSVRNYSSFRVNPLVMDASAHSALQAIHQGFGVSSGCMIAGLAYSLLGPAATFWIAASVSAAWCVIFALLYPFCRRSSKQQKVRYSRIMQDERGADDSDLSETDWLEAAMKRQD